MSCTCPPDAERTCGPGCPRRHFFKPETPIARLWQWFWYFVNKHPGKGD